MIGQTLAHYRIVEKIGEGGMGVVYRAHDERLDRDVALKLLPPGLLADESTRIRFRKEALALAKLSHPNIGVIHDFDTQTGTDFLVMELIPGETLGVKLAGGALPQKEIAALGGQIAAALEEAHERSIIHRDLKPRNIAVTPKGQVKVLDFGLAKLIRPEGDQEATRSVAETRAVAGTLPYMAPEQLRGEALDARTDIYALGVVLYEMATGRRPFQADTSPKLTDSILHEAPVAPSRFHPRIAGELERIILKCLEKDPDNRYQSAREVAVDLRRLAVPAAASAPPWQHVRFRKPLLIGSAVIAAIVLVAAVILALNPGGLRERLWGGAATPIQSVAVLPLENLSRSPEQDYFADGMTEALITELAKIGALRVASRTSSMRYKGTKKSIPEIARELDVDGVIEGSVLREGEQVRITVELIRGRNDRQLWAESYQRELRGVLALQGEVARAIAGEVRIKLTPEERARLTSARPVNPKAYETYLKGRYFWNQRTPESLEKAAEYFQQAIAEDPLYALAYAGLADSYDLLGSPLVGAHDPRDFLPKAKSAAMKALGLDDKLAEAHTSLIFATLFYEWDWAEAERLSRRAIELNPNYPTAHQWYSFTLAVTGRVKEALAEIKRARELDPLSPVLNSLIGWPSYLDGDYDLAINEYQRALQMDPNFYLTHFFLGVSYEAKGMFAQATDEFQKAFALSGGNTEMEAAIGHAYAVSGKRAEARKVLQKLGGESKHTYASPCSVALIYVGLGEKDQAFKWLQTAFDERAGWLIWLRLEHRFDPLRSDPRFQDLLRRMNFPL